MKRRREEEEKRQKEKTDGPGRVVSTQSTWTHLDTALTRCLFPLLFSP